MFGLKEISMTLTYDPEGRERPPETSLLVWDEEAQAWFKLLPCPGCGGRVPVPTTRRNDWLNQSRLTYCSDRCQRRVAGRKRLAAGKAQRAALDHLIRLHTINQLRGA